MDEHATERDARNKAATDERYAGEPTLDGDPLADSAPPGGNFEHRRIVSVARRGLFGGGRLLRIGRYAVERRLGIGGMGEVYLARDEALDRRIAVKRVRSTSANERDQERLRREARALARLSHPNVVQVYEVDEHEGRTFVAMEYVDGQTVGEWLDERPRPWRAVLQTFLAAGRGLVAAHEAGLVHRDFKPDNVLLGRDGSVRVADFGLALAGEEHRAVALDPTELPSHDTRMSVTGAIIGTIRYMPLEQLCGQEVDARSDQFSFCVALYEALWRQAPFSLDSSIARLRELQTVDPAAPPRGRSGSRAPAALWRIVRRGLHRDPAARWPSMQSLLAALDGMTRRRRRLAWATGAVAVAALGLRTMVVDGAAVTDPCASVEHELRGTWDDDRRAELDATAATMTEGHVADSHARVAEGLDRWAAGWTEVRDRVCHAHAEQRVEPMLARQQSTCLTRQRQRADDLVGLLLPPHASADALAGAVDAVAELPPASDCEDELALLGVEPPAAAIADRVEALRRDLDRAHELRLLGRVDEALTLAEQTEEATRGIEYGPLRAEALAELARSEVEGGSLSRAIERLEEAIDAAELHRHDHLAAELWTELTLRTLADLNDDRAGSWDLRRAEVASRRIELSVRWHARLTFAHGQLAEHGNDLTRAEQDYRAALAFAAQEPAAAADIPSYWSNLARLVGKGDRSGPETMELHRVALVAAEQHYGANHPQTARRAYLFASALQEHDPERAADLFRRAASIWTKGHIRPHRELATARFLLAKLALNAGDLDGAEQQVRELAKIRAEHPDVEYSNVEEPAYLLATIHAIRGEHAEALEQAHIALALWEPIYGIDSDIVQRLRSIVAATLLAMGRIDDAQEQLDSLLPHVIGNPEEASIRLHRCEAAIRRGRLDDADAELRAIERRDDGAGPHEFSYAILRGLVDLRRGALGPATLANIRNASADTTYTSSQIVTWLSQLEMTTAEQKALSLE